jgi:hypothetical protein
VTSHASKVGHTIGSSADTVRSYTEAVVTTPRVWIGSAETAGSLLLMYAGETGAEAGAAACLTGIGCFAGAPLAAVKLTARVALAQRRMEKHTRAICTINWVEGKISKKEAVSMMALSLIPTRGVELGTRRKPGDSGKTSLRAAVA